MEAKRTAVVVGVDPGNLISGIAILIEGRIHLVKNADNEEIFDMIKEYSGTKYKLRVVIEDVAAYSMRISPQIISTCKWIGEWMYRLKTARIASRAIVRSKVKTWVFNSFTDLVVPLVEEKIVKNGTVTANGDYYKASHMFVDDRIVIKAMELRWAVRYHREGRRKMNQYGLEEHSWQALALATMCINGFPVKTKTPAIKLGSCLK